MFQCFILGTSTMDLIGAGLSLQTSDAGLSGARKAQS
jgi:hypothetical protein